MSVILCIDDDSDVRNLLEKILTGVGYTVITAGDGRQGLFEARNNKPDLILLDVMMPEIDGFSVCSQLQVDQETAYIPVIFLTALDSEDDRAKAFAVGAVDYLAKPIQKESLLVKAEEQLKTRLHWKELKNRVVLVDGTVQPEHFFQFKQSLMSQFDLSLDVRDRLAATAPLDIYKICEPMGITQGRMTARMADFLSFPMILTIDPANLLMGVIPVSFARENSVVAMFDEKYGRSFILSNPFDWILLDTLKKFFGLQQDTILNLAEPDQIEALFEQPEEGLVMMSAVREQRPGLIPGEPDQIEALSGQPEEVLVMTPAVREQRPGLIPGEPDQIEALSGQPEEALVMTPAVREQRPGVIQAEPDHREALLAQPVEQLVAISGTRVGKSSKIPARSDKKISSKDVGKGPVVAIANDILSSAVSERASDIHIEPKVDHTLIRFRIDGDMRDIYKLKNATGIMLISRLKAIAGLDITERRKPQDGAVETVIAGRTFQLRLATTSTPTGESLIMRMLEPEVKAKELQSLGMTDDQVRAIIDSTNRHQGLLLIVGPTGSGKTTTIYSLLFHIDCRTRSLISVEDPVEYRIPFANQQQVNEKGGVTFDALLKSSVRQDPDILYIGEVRDNYSARIAMDFASTGHLTISTLHTSNATTAIFRLERLGISRGIMADSILGIVAQRLIKKLCPHCKVVKPISDKERDQLRPFLTEIPSETSHPVGCPQCSQTGYFGREAVYEIIRFDPEIVDMVRSEEPIAAIRSFIQQRGDYLISNHAAEKVQKLTIALKDVNEKILLEEKFPRKSLPSSLDAKSVLGVGKGYRTILLVEDDDDTQKLITRILENASYDVTIAGDGIEALTRLEQKDFDLILSDINMPNLDGFKLIEMINQKGIVAPIIFLTGSTSEQDEIRGFELGAVDYIRKPIRKELLLSRVQNVLNKRERRREI